MTGITPLPMEKVAGLPVAGIAAGAAIAPWLAKAWTAAKMGYGAWSAYNAADALSRGEYLSAGLNAIGIIPGIGATGKALRQGSMAAAGGAKGMQAIRAAQAAGKATGAQRAIAGMRDASHGIRKGMNWLGKKKIPLVSWEARNPNTSAKWGLGLGLGLPIAISGVSSMMQPKGLPNSLYDSDYAPGHGMAATGGMRRYGGLYNQQPMGDYHE